MSIHTPGPWKVAQITHNSQLKSHERRGYAGSIAYVYTDRPYPQGICVASVREELLGEVEANAQLIAAAPDMLKELEGCLRVAKAHYLDMVDQYTDDDPDIEEHLRHAHPNIAAAAMEVQRLKAVIQKAKGGI